MDRTHPSSSPVETICNGGAAGLWLLDPEFSRIEFTVKQLWRLSLVRARFGRLGGHLEIGERGAINGSLSVDPRSVDSSSPRFNKKFCAAEIFEAERYPLISFASRHVLLVMPDQAWVMGTLNAGGRSVPVAFEATLSIDPQFGKTVVDAKMKTAWWEHDINLTPRFSRVTMASLVLHLAFVQMH